MAGATTRQTQDVINTTADKTRDNLNAGMDKAKEATSTGMDKAKDLVSSGVDKARDAAQAGVDKARELGQSAGQMAENLTSSVGSSMESLASNVREKAPHEGMIGSAASSFAGALETGGRYIREEGFSGMAEDLTNIIRRNPLTSVMVGIALGFLLARSTRE